MSADRGVARPVVAIGALNACTSAGGAPATGTVRDSAGVTIVENTVARWDDGHGWRVS